MTPEEIRKILDDHEKWLEDEDGGERANLRDANLSGANLRGADLRDAQTLISLQYLFGAAASRCV